MFSLFYNIQIYSQHPHNCIYYHTGRWRRYLWCTAALSTCCCCVCSTRRKPCLSSTAAQCRSPSGCCFRQWNLTIKQLLAWHAILTRIRLCFSHPFFENGRFLLIVFFSIDKNAIHVVTIILRSCCIKAIKITTTLICTAPTQHMLVIPSPPEVVWFFWSDPVHVGGWIYTQDLTQDLGSHVRCALSVEQTGHFNSVDDCWNDIYNSPLLKRKIYHNIFRRHDILLHSYIFIQITSYKDM